MTTEFRSEGAADGGVKQRAAETASTAATHRRRRREGGRRHGRRADEAGRRPGQGAGPAVGTADRQRGEAAGRREDAAGVRAHPVADDRSPGAPRGAPRRGERRHGVPARRLTASSKVSPSRLEGGGASGIADELSTFARRRPGTFLAAAALAGFAAGRLARAGTAVVHDQQQSQSMSAGTEAYGAFDAPYAATGTESMDLIAATPVFGDPIGTSPAGTTTGLGGAAVSSGTAGLAGTGGTGGTGDIVELP